MYAFHSIFLNFYIFLFNFDFQPVRNIFDNQKENSIYNLFFVFFGGSLQEHKIVLLSEFLSLFGANLSFIDFVNFIANQNDGYLLFINMIVGQFQPRGNILKRNLISNIIYQYDTVSIFKVSSCECSVSLLSRSIPQLYSNKSLSQSHRLQTEVHSDGTLGVWFELSVFEDTHDVRLTNTRVSQEDYFYEISDFAFLVLDLDLRIEIFSIEFHFYI